MTDEVRTGSTRTSHILNFANPDMVGNTVGQAGIRRRTSMTFSRTCGRPGVRGAV